MKRPAATRWDDIYRARQDTTLSWFEEQGGLSSELIHAHGDMTDGVLIVGAGVSRVPDVLARAGAQDVTVLDISGVAVAQVLERLMAQGCLAEGLVADLARWKPHRAYAVWQDRAVFHFLSNAADQAAYLKAMKMAVMPDGIAVIATFDLDGPDECSGLPVQRYDEDTLVQRVQEVCGTSFAPIDSRRQIHVTPTGIEQPFRFVVFRRVA